MFGQTPGITNQSVLGAAAGDTIDQIQDTLSAELILRETGGLLTADGTEQTLYITEPPGCINPRALFINLDNMVALDVTVIRVYYRITSGGTLQLFDYQSYNDINGGLANGRVLLAVELLPNRFGFQVTLEQTGGTMRTYRWSYLGEE